MNEITQNPNRPLAENAKAKPEGLAFCFKIIAAII
jgi:hypothetical protein